MRTWSEEQERESREYGHGAAGDAEMVRRSIVVEKHEMKWELNNLALLKEEPAAIVPFDKICGMRGLVGMVK